MVRAMQQLPDNFYLAIHTKAGEEQIRKVLATIYFAIAQQKNENLRLMVLLFSDQLEAIDIIRHDTLDKFLDFSLHSAQWNDGSALNGIINIVLGDCLGLGLVKPKLLIYTEDQKLKCWWHLSILSQIIEIVWLGKQVLDVGVSDRIDFKLTAVGLLQDVTALLTVQTVNSTKRINNLIEIAKILIS